MAWGNMTIGRLALKETSQPIQDTASAGGVMLSVSGQEHNPGRTLPEVRARQADLLALLGETVPVVFEHKTEHNGYYQVVAAEADMLVWPGEAAATRWSLQLQSLGPDNAVDIEARLGNAIRLNDYGQTGIRWNSPPIGADGYYTEPTSPSGSFTRTGANGAQVIFTGIPAGLNPRYACPVGSFNNGRVRFLSGTVERTSARFAQANSGWTVDNGLVRISPLSSGGQLRVESHDGTQWEAKDWHFARGGATTSLGTLEQVNVLVNRPEIVVVRLLRNRSVGRTLVDLTLRRGSRLVEVYLQDTGSNTLGAYLNTPETFTDVNASGYVWATANDAAGNKAAAGSPRAFTANTNGGLSKDATTTMSLWLGSVVGGTGAVAGDLVTDLRDQYIGTQTEQIGVVPR